MSISPIRPPVAFSNTLHADTAGKGLFVSKEEKDCYAELKETIQDLFVSNVKCADKEEFDIGYSPSNPKVLSNVVLNHLKDQLDAGGFDMTVKEEGGKSYIIVTVPEVVREESGRRSPGWGGSFKASVVMARIQENLNNTYNEKAKEIEKVLCEDSGVYQREVSVKNLPSSVIDWLKEDLTQKGFQTRLSWGNLIISNPPKEVQTKASWGSKEAYMKQKASGVN